MDWANDNAICCEHEFTKVFKYEQRPTTLVRVLPDGTKPLVWTMETDNDWENWFENEHPTPKGPNRGLILILARRKGEQAMDPVKKVKLDDWIQAIRRATANAEHASTPSLRETGRRRALRNLPFSKDTFREIAGKFHIHESIVRMVSRADVPDFSATKLEMGEQNGYAFPAYVYNARTPNVWEQDLALSATYFPHSGLTFAVLYGCTLPIEAEVLTRLEKVTYEIGHPLLMPGILVELERKRLTSVVDEALDEMEAHVQQLNPLAVQDDEDDGPIIPEKTRISAYLDLLHLRNQLITCKTCLEALRKEADNPYRKEFRETDLSYQEEAFLDPVSGLHDSVSDLYLAESSEDMRQPSSDGKSIPLAVSKFEMRRTGRKIQGRLQEIIKEYEEKIRECTAGIEGMAMATR